MQQPSLADDALRLDAFNLIAALDAYDVACIRLMENWFDPQAYADFGRRIEAIREHGVAVPALTVLSLQLVIAHAELVSTLWQNAAVGVVAAGRQEVRARHTVAIEPLRTAAARLLRSE